MARPDLTFKAQFDLQRRIGLFYILTLGIFLLLLLRLWQLQVLEGDRYEDLSKGNHLRLRMEEGCRGLILDRNEEILAENRPCFDVWVTPGNIQHPRVVSYLSQLLKVDHAELLRQIEEGRSRPDEPILVKRDIDEVSQVALQERKFELGGVTLLVRPVRSYPNGDFATHLLGYVSEVNPWQLSREENRDFRHGERLGQGGVEGAYDALLRGVEGGEQVEVDASGHQTRSLGRIEPKSGYTLMLSLDSRIQRLAEESLRGQEGVAAVMDPRTGEVLALVSKPAYDPNLFSSLLTKEEWTRLVGNPHHPLQNRVLQAAYPPGSIFKLITAIAALNKGVITPQTQFRCTGSFSLGSYNYGCWKKEGHGNLNLKQAIAQSCNVYFYNVAMRLGIEEMAGTAKEFGIGEIQGLRLCEEARGLVPTPDWKKEVKGEKWYLGNTLQAAIGQGMITATPLQILQMVSAVANGGHLLRPMVVKEIRAPGGDVVERYGPEKIREIALRPDVLPAVRKGMWAVVNDNGTGALAKVEGFEVCGKTATAQVVSRPQEGAGPRSKRLTDHAWFVCFAPETEPEVAIVVLVEHGGRGSIAAAQVAKQILEGIFSQRQEMGVESVKSPSSLPREKEGRRSNAG
jgi:penicillin-binding protein 2